MDNRCFRLLGIRDDASKAEVEKAYTKWCNKYKSDDYSDDPDYVQGKLAELRVAYNEAMAISSGDVPIETSPKSSFSQDDDNNQGNKKIKIRNLKDTLNSISDNVTEKSKKVLDEGSSNIKPEIRIDASEEENYNYAGEAYSANVCDSGVKGGPIYTIIAVIIMIVILFFVTINNDSDSSNFEDYGETEIDYYSLSYNDNFTYVDGKDNAIAKKADAVYEASHKLDTNEVESEYEVSSSELLDAADKFAKKYFDGQTIAAQADKLSSRYPDDFFYSYGETGSALKEILSFYGFPEPYFMQGDVNPYNNKTIITIIDYLQYLDDFYDAHYKK